MYTLLVRIYTEYYKNGVTDKSRKRKQKILVRLTVLINRYRDFDQSPIRSR